jgi:hypothetical protein
MNSRNLSNSARQSLIRFIKIKTFECSSEIFRTWSDACCAKTWLLAFRRCLSIFFFILNVSIINNMIITNSKIIGKRQVSELQISDLFVKLG